MTKLEAFDQVGEIVLSKDGKVAAYTAIRNSEQFVVVGDKPVLVSSWAAPPVLSADGKSVAYYTADGYEHYVVADGPTPESYFVVVGRIIDFVISPDGKSVAYTAQEKS